MATKKKTVKKTRKRSVKNVNKLLGQLDVVFVIDTTASMFPFIQEAKNRAVDVMKEIEKDKDLDIKVALVEYRDHPPQDITFVTRKYDFDNIDNLTATLNKLFANGGGDRPEAVWPAIRDLDSLTWRANSDRLVYLIGDSPPHGYDKSGGDAWPNGDPSGIKHEDLISLLIGLKIKLNAHSIANHDDTTTAFKLLVDATKGEITVGSTPQHTTTLYASSLTYTGMSVNDGRALYTSAVEMSGSYNVASATIAGASLGWDKDRTTKAINYLNNRGITE